MKYQIDLLCDIIFKKYKVYEIMMPIKLFVYRLRVNQYGLVSIKYIQDGYIKYAVFEKKYLEVNNGYNNSFNLGKRQYQSNLVMYVRSVHKDEIKTHDVKLIYYARAVDKKHIKHANNDCHSFTSKHFEYDICNYNKSSKVLIITSDDYPDKVFVYYQNIPNKLFSIKRLTEYDISFQLNKKFQNILKKK